MDQVDRSFLNQLRQEGGGSYVHGGPAMLRGPCSALWMSDFTESPQSPSEMCVAVISILWVKKIEVEGRK